MNNSSLKFVIVGHVDHGKSTLIGRLLYDTSSLAPDKIEEIKKVSKERGKKTEFAYLLDHLEEERRQGITIETTQTFFKTEKRGYVIIDAPGHVEFIKNMLTGASQAEAAVLIVDAKEGIKEQTRRHAYLLSLLGIKQVIVVINKLDLIDFSREKFDQVREQIALFLKAVGIKPGFYLPIAATSGENLAQRPKNMPWYPGPSFLETLDRLKNKKPPENSPLLFPIQDVYTLGDKKISAGRIEAGKIKKGQAIKVLPNGQTTKVSSIEKFRQQTKEATAGESIGITTEDPLLLNRGEVVCEAGKEPEITDSFSASIFWMADRPLQKDEKIILRCATQTVGCRIDKIIRRINSSTLKIIREKTETLENLDAAEVAIRTKKTIVISPFNKVQELGRFVLERENNICAGGIIR